MIIQPGNTALLRNGPSLPLRQAAQSGWLTSADSILDFGCGRGGDVSWLREQRLNATGYDTHHAFGYDKRPEGQFDLVLMFFVVNVIPYHHDRISAVNQAWEFIRPGGAIMLASRHPAIVERRAKRGRWPVFEDGYWSNKSRGMFQRGFSVPELELLMAHLSKTETIHLPPREYTAIFARKS